MTFMVVGDELCDQRNYGGGRDLSVTIRAIRAIEKAESEDSGSRG